MGRRKGSLNKSTLARLAAEAAAQQPGAQPALPVASSPPGDSTEGASHRDASTFELHAPAGMHFEPASALEPQAVPSNAAFIEYLAPGGEKWRVERGEDLLRTFGIDREEITTWHSAIAPQERAWRLVRMRFAMAPLLAGPGDGEFLVPRSDEEIAQRLQIELSAVQLEMDAVRGFWARWAAANRKSEVGGRKSEVPEVDEMERSTEAEREITLKAHGFAEIKDANERLFVFSRIHDLKDKLDEPEGRTLVQRCIRIELRMQRNDTIIARLEHEAADPKTETDRVRELRKEIDAFNTLSKDLGEQHLKLMRAMGATQEQNPTVQKKVAFVDCLGQLVRGIQEYESKGDNTIIDGVFTAAEVKVLTTPMSLRPPQYRLDIVMLIRDAMKHENLWNPEYEPPAIQRDVYRRMRKALRDVLGAAENENGVFEMEDDEVPGGLEEDDSAPLGPGDAVSAPAVSAASAAPLPGGYQRPALGPGRVRPGDDFTVG